MGRETEIKLEIPASAASKVMRLPWLWEQASGEVTPTRMIATYFDTPGHALRKRGMSFRVRRVGNKTVQTIKGPQLNGSPLARKEWESEIDGITPQLDLAPPASLKPISRRKLGKALTPLFEVRVERSAYPVQSANSDIEISIDRAHITAEDASVSFCEIELELKRGASSELARLGRRIAAEVPASLGLKSKSERGFELRMDERSKVYRAEPIVLAPETPLSEAFQLIAWSCLRQFALNQDAVRLGAAEGVHQMRIGLRRLRAAMSLFGDMLDGPETDAVERELSWITDELGPARDFEVFLDRTLSPAAARAPDDAALSALVAEVSSRRDDAVTRARAAVSGDRFRELTLRTALWILAGEWSDASTHVRPTDAIQDFAQQTLTRRTRKLVRRLSRVRQLSDRARHKLRIRVKKLRYASEFFASLFDHTSKRDRRAFAQTLEDLQDGLGRMNDIAVHRGMGRELVASWTANDATGGAHAAAHQYALGFAIGQEQHEIESCGRKAVKAGKRLATLPAYWLS